LKILTLGIKHKKRIKKSELTFDTYDHEDVSMYNKRFQKIKYRIFKLDMINTNS